MRPQRLFLLIPIAGLAVVAWTKARVLERTNINWDEFNFLHHVTKVVDGTETLPFLTFHGHLFSWVLKVSDVGIEQIIAGRRAMFALWLVTVLLVGWIGRRLIGGSAGVFAAFVASVFAVTLEHGTAFRYDPLLVTLFLGAAAACLNRGWAGPVIAGACMALAGLVTLKASLFIPSLVVVLLAPALDARHRSRALKRAGLFLVTGAVVGGLLLWWHRWGMEPRPASRWAASAANTALGRLFPQRGAFLNSLADDPVPWELLLLGLVISIALLVRSGTSRAHRTRLLRVLALAAPLASIVFYRNAFPYFYTSVLPGAALLAGVAWRGLELTARGRRSIAWAAGAGVLLLCLPLHAWYEDHRDDTVARQRAAIEGVRQIFPEPVPYLDRCGMAAPYPRVGLFMSSWTMTSYRARQRPVVREWLTRDQPVFVLANISSLELDAPWRKHMYAWLPEDYALLQDHYLHHWGPVWVAGRQLQLEPGVATPTEILIAGRHTIEATVPVEIDGRRFSPGDVVLLEQGTHHVTAVAEQQVTVRLRWGDHLPVPDKRLLPDGELFVGF